MGLLLSSFPRSREMKQLSQSLGHPLWIPRTSQTASGRTAAGVGTIRNGA